jgi:hypothetical protein
MDIEVQKLLDELMNEASNTDVDIEELMNTLSERIKERSEIIGKRRWMIDLEYQER